jgi:hypothetical protein
MKTSNKILISFLSLIGLFMLSLMIQISPDKEGTINKDSVHEAIALPGFTHLIINDSCNILISSGPTDSINLYYNKNIQLKEPIFTVKGDTLIIHSFPGKENSNTNIVCHSLKSVNISNAKLNISKLTLPSLNIQGTNSTICLYDSVTIHSATFRLKKGSQIWCDYVDIYELQIDLERSKANFNVKVINELKANLTDFSELSVTKVLHSDVKNDESSKYYMR